MGDRNRTRSDRTTDGGIESPPTLGFGSRRTVRYRIAVQWQFGLTLVGVCLTIAGSLPAVGGEPDSRSRPSFSRDIRPILSDACFPCHGPDSGTRRGNLRLDQRRELFRLRDGHSLIVANAPEKSTLYQRIASDDEDTRMPPGDSPRQLSRREIELIRDWIDAGSVWEEHWAYAPIVRPPVPTTDVTAGFVRNEIDAFMLAELEKRGLAPSAEANRRTLIRRLNLDLLGLPPTPAEVDAFLADSAPDAWERFVDRTLASPRFGERMALFWLDLVRYADTNGYLGDRHENRDLYRDWVIQAFNRDLPFDQFTREQLAGDLLPHANDDTRIASGYNRLLMTTREAGAQPKEYLARYSADRVRNFSAVWLASTMGCANCHDHKFDPFTMRDFYGLAAVFADIQELAVGAQPQTRFPTVEQAEQIARLDEQIAAQRQRFVKGSPMLKKAQQRWEASLRTKPILWTVLRPRAVESFAGSPVKILKDDSIRVQYGSARDVITVSCDLPWNEIEALRLDAIPDDILPMHGPGWGDAGGFVVTSLRVSVDGHPLELTQATATRSSPGFEVESLLRPELQRGWGVVDRSGESQSAIFQFAPSSANRSADVRISLHQESGDQRVLGRFQLSTTTARSVRADSKSTIPNAVWKALVVSPSFRTPEEQETVAAYFRSVAPELKLARQELAELHHRRDQVESGVRKTLISTSGPPREIRILPRGDWLDETGPVAIPRTPNALFQMRRGGTGRMTRLELAEWVTSPENPLPARVLVNRLWQLFFGQGIVQTLEDFGSQGTPPTHPELLDWLASELMQPAANEGSRLSPVASTRSSGNDESQKWRLKRLIRQMVTSATYRQSSADQQDALRRDPENRWLSHQSRQRISAEMVRDHALAVSGLLSQTVGGKSVKPYQPERYWSLLNREWDADTGDSQFRRGLYTYRCRTFLHPSLKAFDATTREECVSLCPQSNTPLQALVLLNDPTFVEAARGLAMRALREGGDDLRSRLHFAYREVLSRAPRSEELVIMSNLYSRHRQQFADDPKSAEDLLDLGIAPVSDQFPVEEIAAWVSVTRVLLNLHETITRN